MQIIYSNIYQLDKLVAFIKKRGVLFTAMRAATQREKTTSTAVKAKAARARAAKRRTKAASRAARPK